jgi:hypothetical protein
MESWSQCKVAEDGVRFVHSSISEMALVRMRYNAVNIELSRIVQSFAEADHVLAA